MDELYNEFLDAINNEGSIIFSFKANVTINVEITRINVKNKMNLLDSTRPNACVHALE